VGTRGLIWAKGHRGGLWSVDFLPSFMNAGRIIDIIIQGPHRTELRCVSNGSLF